MSVEYPTGLAEETLEPVPKHLLLLSDLHLGGEHGEDGYARQLQSKILASYDPMHTAIAVLGDVCDEPTGSWGLWRWWVHGLEEAGFVVLVVPGNHDVAPGGWRGVRHHHHARALLELITARPRIQGEMLCGPWHVDLWDWRFVLLDSTAELVGWDARPDLARGELGARQLRQAKRLAKASHGRHAYLLHHHPTYRTHFVEGDNELHDAALLRALVAETQPALVACGHRHRAEELRLEGAALTLACPKATAPTGQGMACWQVSLPVDGPPEGRLLYL